MAKYLLIFLVSIGQFSIGQQIIDSCFSSSTPSTGFPSSGTISSLNGDLLQWTGSSWTGAWPNSNVTAPPPAGGAGCRAIWIGNASTWTTGGEGFALLLNAPLVAGNTYSYNFTTISNGFGSTGSFSPLIYTNSSPNVGFLVGSLPAAGTSWVTNTFTFTATAAQNGHTWLVIHNGTSGTSGLVNNFCVACNVPQTTTCSVNLGPDLNLCPGQTATLNATTSGASYLWQNNSTAPTFTVNSAGTYSVTITVGTCTATDAVNVTYGTLPTVNLGNDLTLCAGQTTVLDATSNGSTYLWQNGSTSSTFTVSQAGTYSVAVTNSCGTATDNIIVNFNPYPVVNLGNDVTLCTGDNLLLDVTNAGANYLWQDNSTGATFNVTQAGTYSVTASIGNCSVSDVINVAFTNSPTVDLGNDTILCEGQSLVLDATIPGSTYLWQDNTTSPTYNVTQTGLYSVDIITACGLVSDQINVQFLPSPIIDLGNDTVFCQGGSITLDATNPNTTYLWQDNSTNSTLTVNQSGLYSVIVTNAQGCQTSDQINVTVDNIPVVSGGADLSVCEGASVVLTGSGASTYSWTNSVSNNVAFIPPAGTTVYTVTGTTPGGCTNTDDVTITVGEVSLNFTVDVTEGCSPLTVNLTNTSPGAGSCLWTISDGTVVPGCGTVTVVLEDAGCHDVTLTAEFGNGCYGTLTQNNFICIEETPEASFIPVPNQVTTIETLVDFQNTSTGGSTYVWDFGDNSDLSEDENPEHEYPEGIATNYLVTLIAYSPLGCTDTAYSYIEVWEELIYYVPNSFTPDGDEFNEVFQPVFTSGFDPYDYNIKIFDRWGEVIFESNNPFDGWDGSYMTETNLYKCQSGTYTWKIEFKARNNDERSIITGHVTLLR